ncbi:DEAD/DEAH box helicase [Chitinimonas lacunae]|uniref:DEAD/DEAH box helicase n=1 Tax=Chitinimonas lacunae TaxID=1963018 RepID=A0ABV8MNQ7_9NEIS
MTQTQTTFADLGLAQPILNALSAAGYTQPTPIQAAAVPSLLAGRDVLASAATGTGKTAAFMLPALQRLTEKSERPGRGPRMLVLSPTRELAAQIKSAAETYGRQMRFCKVVSIVGGMPYPTQIKLLSSPFEILVATPGRLLDLMARGRIDFARLEMLVLDEADRMLDLGFRDDIAEIAKKLPAERVTALFSATLDDNIAVMARTLLKEPERIEIAPPEKRNEQIVEKLHYADDIGHKSQLLERVLGEEGLGQAIIFTATKHDAASLADKLFAQGRKAAALHGDMQQRERMRTLTKLKRGEIDILVATDVAARGIDVAGITHVVNFDLPKFAEDYVHRIGRTGRAGREGIAISFAAKHEMPALKRIEKFVGRSIEPFSFDGLKAHFEPRNMKSGGGRGERFGGGGRRPPRDGQRFGGNREGSSRQGYGQGGEQRSYGGGNRQGYGQGGEQRSYGGNRQGYGQGGEQRSYGGGNRQGYGQGGEQRSYGGGNRQGYGQGGEQRSYGSGNRQGYGQGGEQRSYGGGNRQGYGQGGEQRSYGGGNRGDFQGQRGNRDGQRRHGHYPELKDFE